MRVEYLPLFKRSFLSSFSWSYNMQLPTSTLGLFYAYLYENEANSAIVCDLQMDNHHKYGHLLMFEGKVKSLVSLISSQVCLVCYSKHITQ